MQNTVEENKEKFLNIFNTYIKREGADKLLDYLTNTSDFFTAPASGRRHSNFEGGLCLHSLNVYERFKKILKAEYGENYASVIPEESVAIIGLLHDLCKVNTYTVDYRNQKIDGQWVQVPYYAYSNKLPYGHGEKSVYIISGYMRLTRDEAMAINWHMGAFDPRCQGGSDMYDAFTQYPLIVLFNMADMLATYMDER